MISRDRTTLTSSDVVSMQRSLCEEKGYDYTPAGLDSKLGFAIKTQACNGAPIQIYFSPVDVQAFEKAVKEQLGAVVLAHRHPARLIEPTDSTVSKNPDGFRSFGYLIRPQDLDKVVVRHVPAQGHWVVDETRSPVVELDGGFDDGKILRRGRLYFQKGFYGEDGQWMNKPQEFLQWAEEILKLAKKLSRRDQKLEAYIGRSAAEEQSSGCVFVAP